MSPLGILLLGLSLVVPSTVASERYQPDVAVGAVDRLNEARLEVQKSIAVGATEEQIVAWRYDWAYLNWRMAQHLRGVDERRRRELLKEAKRQLDLVLEASPEDAEAWALHGTVIGDRVTGALSGALLGRRASASLKRAAELDTESPRVALLRGLGLYFTPKTFGGDKGAAEAEVRRATELFERPGGDEEGWPSWGHEDALAWLGVMLAERREPEAARRLYERALAVRPESVWVRDRLLPALDDSAPER